MKVRLILVSQTERNFSYTTSLVYDCTTKYMETVLAKIDPKAFIFSSSRLAESKIEYLM